jgi:vitamin K-dependent gamma-carboxylase
MDSSASDSPTDAALKTPSLEFLFHPISLQPLIWFRVLFGVLLIWEVSLFFTHNFIELYYVKPPFHMTYLGFGWVRPWPENGMYVHFIILGVAALMISVGFLTRLASAVFCLGFGWVFLLEKTRYLNHFYLIILLSGMLAFIPTNGQFSIDSWLNPSIRRRSGPAWGLYLLRFQFGIVYVFAAVAKMYSDWLNGSVMKEMLSYKMDFPVIGVWFDETWMIMLFSYLGLIFDLLIVPALFWKPTRWYALGAAVCFHLMNARLFNIDVFPWLMLGATVILFAPDLLPSWAIWKSTISGTATREPSADFLVPDIQASPVPAERRRPVTVVLIAIYCVVQILVPLRHYLYPGEAAWTDEGHLFAWRMLMRTKTGLIPEFPMTYRENGRTIEGRIPILQNTDFWGRHWQARHIVTDPDMVLQFCQLSADALRRDGLEPLEIRAIVPVSLNGREPQLLIDPDVNLLREKRSLWPQKWVMPLKK